MTWYNWLGVLVMTSPAWYPLLFLFIPFCARSFSSLPTPEKLAISGLVAVFNIRLLKLLNARRSPAFAGASEMSTRGHWVTHTGKFHMNATRRETGEWTPPVSAVWWLLLINGILLGAGAIAAEGLNKYAIVFSSWSLWYVYPVLLPVPCILLRMKARKHG